MGLDLLFGFSVGFGISVWIFCEVMVVDDWGLMVVGGLMGMGDFGFVLGL